LDWRFFVFKTIREREFEAPKVNEANPLETRKYSPLVLIVFLGGKVGKIYSLKARMQSY
jgi:hypothetical protein